MPWILFAVLGALLFLLALHLVAGYVALRMSLRREKEKPLSLQEPDPDTGEREALRDAGKRWLFAQSPEEVTLRARDGLTLHGYFLPAKKPTRHLVVFSHGYHCNGPAEFGAFLRFYHEELGYHILLPDHRTHGRSEGKHIGFSALEWQDILDWTEVFVKRLGAGTEVVLHGMSMGAATVMKCNAHNPPAYIKCVVEDCGYADGYEMISLVAKRDLHLNYPPVIWAAALFFRLYNRCSLRRDASPFRHIAQFKKPTLFIHGLGDLFIPSEMCTRCYEAATVPKDLLLVEGAGRTMSYYLEKERYEAKLREFFAQWMTPEDSSIPTK